jgi:lysophospholipase L1-like esterase
MKPHNSPPQASGRRKPAVNVAEQKRFNSCNVIRTLTHPARLLVLGTVILMIGAMPGFGQEKKTPAKPRFELKDGDRVVFLGNTFIERMQRYGYIETMLTARWPDRKIIFRNLGWSGDTVWAESRNLFDLPRSRAVPSKGYTRMIEHVGRIKPTVIFLGYGNNEAFEGKARLAAFIKQYEKLMGDLTKVSAKGVRFVMIRPFLYPEHEGPLKTVASRNDDIELYHAALWKFAERRQIPMVDWFKRIFETTETPVKGPRNVITFHPPHPGRSSFDGIHISDEGYRLSASGLSVQIRAFGNNYDISPTLVFLVNRKSLNSGGLVDVKLTRQGDGLRIAARRTMLTRSDIQIAFKDLLPGRYTLKIDGKPVRTDSAKAWYVDNGPRPYGPDAKQFEKLRATIVAKNQLYFYSWRPQNTTYLFGFRKHEQGQNAKEVAEFSKLVADKEREIDRLKKPVSRTYELIRVKKENK